LKIILDTKLISGYNCLKFFLIYKENINMALTEVIAVRNSPSAGGIAV